MPIYNDIFNQNLFTLAKKRGDAKITFEVLKFMCSMPQEKLNELAPSIPVKDLIKSNDGSIETIIKNAMVRAVSNYG